jgi:hypothetical protein
MSRLHLGTPEVFHMFLFTSMRFSTGSLIFSEYTDELSPGRFHTFWHSPREVSARVPKLGVKKPDDVPHA